MTVNPASASFKEMARPIPRDAPVTIAVFFIVNILSLCEPSRWEKTLGIFPFC
jgi:hypothetical protein